MRWHSSMDEFTLIKELFAPLTQGFPGALNLTDDAAVFAVPPGQELVVTKDAIVQGVHFIGDEDPALIAKKLLRANLSDLAAMGAAPLCYFMALMLPRDTGADWLQRFTQGLTEDQKGFGIHLAGGDTTATPGPLSLSLTALGTVPAGTALKRSGAKPGDTIYVSGTLGDAALGLCFLTPTSVGWRLGGGQSGHGGANTAPTLPLPLRGREYLTYRYHLPQPRLTLGQHLRGIAHACMDISDGLVQDLDHLCAASGVGATIEAQKLPLSDAAKQFPSAEALNAALSGGDDYELLFTVAPGKASQVPEGCTEIGLITQGSGVQILDDEEKPMVLEKKGYRHF